MADYVVTSYGNISARFVAGSPNIYVQRAALAWGDAGATDLLPGRNVGASALAVTVANDEIKYVDVTISADTAAYASGDLIADAQIVNSAVKATDALGVLASIAVIDEDDQGAAFTIYFANSAASFGTENSAPSITDANARAILGFVDVATTDYKDLGGVKVAFKSNIGMVVSPVTGTDDIYVAIVNGSGTPTYTASGLKLRLGFLG